MPRCERINTLTELASALGVISGVALIVTERHLHSDFGHAVVGLGFGAAFLNLLIFLNIKSHEREQLDREIRESWQKQERESRQRHESDDE